MPTVEQIADAIDQRLAEAGRELASLQAARAALIRTTSSPRANRGATKDGAGGRTGRSAAKSTTPARSKTRQGSRNGRRRATTSNSTASEPPSSTARTNRTSASAGARRRATPAAASDTAAGTGTRRRGRRAQQQAPRAAATSPGTSAPARSPRSASRTTQSAARPRPSRRRSRELEPGRIEELLRASSSGLSLAALAKELDVSAARIRAKLDELQRSGQVRSEGSRRTSRWRLVTDEERIAERVAELERRQASRSSG